MPTLASVYRILVASPSDVNEERDLVRKVIAEWNATNSLGNNVILEPVLWESHSMPEMGNRPQELLNKQIVEICDVLIGFFWTRIGTYTGKAESGTVEEIEEFNNDGKPVLLYFSKKPVNEKNVDFAQYEKLKKFKEKCREKGIFFEYNSNEELSHLLMKHISKQVDALQKVYGIIPKQEEIENQKLKEKKIKNLSKRLDLYIQLLDVEWGESIMNNFRQYSVLHELLKGVYGELWSIYKEMDLEGTEQSKILLKNTLTHMKELLSKTEDIRDARELWDKGKIIKIKSALLIQLNNCLNEIKRIEV